MRSMQLAFLLIVIAGTTLLVFAARNTEPHRVNPFGASTHPSRFGSSGIGSIGWRIPANALIATYHLANRSLSGFLEATLNVFPYEIQTGTSLRLGLYVND